MKLSISRKVLRPNVTVAKAVGYVDNDTT